MFSVFTTLTTSALMIFGCSVVGLTASAQQRAPISRYDLYIGFADLNSPGQNSLNQTGIHLQTGLNISRWSALGFDYSIERGMGSLPSRLAPMSLQQQLATELPPGYHLDLPFQATTQSFSAGGEVVIRRYRSATLFMHPVLAAFHIDATPQPQDPVAKAVSVQLAPNGHMTDWFGAYGAGGGVDLPIARWLGARVQVDAGWNHPFSNLLEHGSVSYRYSIGPAFHFGPAVRCESCP